MAAFFLLLLFSFPFLRFRLFLNMSIGPGIKKTLIFLTISPLIVFLIFFILVYTGFFGELPDRNELSALSNLQSTSVYDSKNQIIGEFYTEKRTSITYEEISPELRQILVEIEDRRFYEHSGIDYYSLLRVFIKSILFRENAGGGSTISQQLAKNIYEREDFGLLYYPVNKLKEMITAHRLESIYSKEELITHYLNTVTFGMDIYGVEKASQLFFNKKAIDLNTAESATIVGSLKATTRYNPVLNPNNSLKRRNEVLTSLHSSGFLSKERYSELVNSPLDLADITSDHQKAPYFLEQIKHRSKDLLDSLYPGKFPDIKKAGLKIHTTLDLSLQKKAEASMKEHLRRIQKEFRKQLPYNFWDKNKNLIDLEIAKLAFRPEHSDEKIKMNLYTHEGLKEFNFTLTDSIAYSLEFIHSGMLVSEPSSGKILVWVGGFDFTTFPLDHILSKRQVGSTIKPFVYASALDNNISPCKLYPTASVSYTVDNQEWKPENAGDSVDQFIRMNEALTHSVNTVSVKILKDAGIQNTVHLLHQAGIRSNIPKVPSIVLGTPSISLFEMVQAYSIFANEGWMTPLYMIERIESSDGIMLYQHKETPPVQVISGRTSKIIRHFLENVINEGTGARLRGQYKLKNSIGGKTGTTQNGSDGWFIGISPGLVAGIWSGGEYPSIAFRNGSKGQGAYLALPIYGLFYQKLNNDPFYRKLTEKTFPDLPDEISEELACNPLFPEFKFLKWLFRGKRTTNSEPEKQESIQWQLNDSSKVDSALEPPKQPFLKRLFRKKHN